MIMTPPMTPLHTSSVSSKVAEEINPSTKLCLPHAHVKHMMSAELRDCAAFFLGSLRGLLRGPAPKKRPMISG